MKYEYDKSLFPPEERKILDYIIKNNKISNYAFKTITKININNKPIFDRNQMLLIAKVDEKINNKSAVDLVSSCTVNEKPSFNFYQMEEIFAGLLYLPLEKVKIYTKLSAKGKAIFSAPEMQQIVHALKAGLRKEELDFLTKLNSRNKPIYNFTQMKILIAGFASKMPNEYVYFYGMADKFNKPIFTAEQMEITRVRMNRVHISADQLKIISDAISKNEQYPRMAADIVQLVKNISACDNKQSKQIIDAIKLNIPMQDILILDNSLSSNSIRILKNLANEGVDSGTLKSIKNRIIDNYESNEDKCREYLKYYKYYFQCLKELNADCSTLKEIFTSLEDIDAVNESMINLISLRSGVFNEQRMDVMKVCLNNKIPLEQIEFISDPSYNDDEMKYLAIALINGINFEKIKSDRDTAKAVLSEQCFKLSENEFNFEIDKER